MNQTQALRLHTPLIIAAFVSLCDLADVDVGLQLKLVNKVNDATDNIHLEDWVRLTLGRDCA